MAGCSSPDAESMRADELTALEHEFGLTLPPGYRATMLAYPFPLEHQSARLALSDDPAHLRRMNAEMRASAPLWPPQAFIVGHDGGEVTYVLDCARTPAVVQELDFETGELTDRTSDWATWLAQLADEERAVAVAREEANAAYRAKRWWQFWVRPWP
jgi:hypothetical protein